MLPGLCFPGLFIGLGMTGIVPGVHYIATDGQIFGCHDWLIFMAVLYLSGGVIYALRLPERLWPGKFDIWVSSSSKTTTTTTTTTTTNITSMYRYLY